MKALTIGVTGSSGMLGSAILKEAKRRGFPTVAFRHQPPKQDATNHAIEVRHFHRHSDASVFEGIDILIHLAGKNLFTLWTQSAKQELWDSRVKLTQHLAKVLQTLPTPPKLVISASGISYYGDRGSEILTETSATGIGFLADLAQAWEAPILNLASENTRVHTLRTSLILAPQSTAWKLLRTAYKLHLGQYLGRPSNYLSWMHLEDYVRMVFHLIDCSKTSGPVNASSPEPVTQFQFHQQLQKHLGKSWLPQIPNDKALRFILGDQSELFVNSLHVIPKKLTMEDFQFRYSTLDEALSHLCAQSTRDMEAETKPR